jgi:hypothetical protein
MIYGKGSLISLILPLFKTKPLASSLRGLAQTEQGKKDFEKKKRTRGVPQVKLRRRNHFFSSLTTLLWLPELHHGDSCRVGSVL